jgi:hypothetical protein
MAKLYFSVLTISMLTIAFVVLGIAQLHDKWGTVPSGETSLGLRGAPPHS